MTVSGRPLSKSAFEDLSNFRYQIRRFERFSEDAVRAQGITSLQYLLLLHVKGFSGREYAYVGELAERLQAAPHGVVALITRCEKAELVERRRSLRDRREIEVHLLDKGEKFLIKLVAMHRAELTAIRGVFPVPIGSI